MSHDSLERSRDAGAPVECYRFQLGGLAWYFTSSDAAVTLLGQRYLPEAIQRKGGESGQDDAAGGLSVTLPRTNPVADLFVAGMPIQPVRLTVYRFHREAPTDLVALPPGEVINYEHRGALVTLSCASVPQLLERKTPALVIQRRCWWALYGPGCQVVRSAFSDVATVAAVDGVEVELNLPIERERNWYAGGCLEDGNGQRAFIVSQDGGTFTLFTPLPGLAVGAEVTAVAGCDHTLPTCDTKFGNALRFMGCPELPVRNPFTEGV